MKIIEYQPKYAALVADMWNRSNSNWGNEDDFQTEQNVIDSEKNSGNIKLYLAMDQGEVVGYCSFSEYKQDEGASYLPLINVRPDYHGKKVGKALILKVLEDAKKSEWPRFDLYTWSGNIKAMPLYKKCGFFWERRNNTVHLMNFIPYVVQTEALSPYVKQLDLYKDSQREINMDYDGVEEDGFDIYYYHFKNKQTYLSLGFEKTGRGLVYIDNPDYEIRLTLPKHKVIENNHYQGQLLIHNKKDKALEIQVQGLDNKNIENDFNQRIQVLDKEEINIPFYVQAYHKKQDLGKTHPVLDLILFIHGLKANLKCGVMPKPPLDIDLETLETMHQPGITYHAFLNLENHLDHQETFHIQCPKKHVEFLEDIDITLKSGEKRSVKIPYTFINYGFYNEKVSLTYGSTKTEKRIKGMFKDLKGSFVSDLDKEIIMASGKALVIYHKDDHHIEFTNKIEQDHDIVFMNPRIGLPYSLEFNNIDPEINILTDHQVTLTFTSKAFKGVSLKVNIMHKYGLLEVSYEIINQGDERTFSLSIPVMKGIKQSYIPYQSRLFKIDEYGGFISNLDASQVDENWLYHDKLKQGFTWPKDIKMKIADWHMVFDIDQISLKKNQSYQTKPFIVSLIHPTLKDFREYVSSCHHKQIINDLEIDINGHNPFIKDKVNASLINHRKAQIEGTITHNNKNYNIDDTIKINEGLQTFKIDLADRILEKSAYLFKVQGQVSMDEKDGVYTVDNGVIKYQADVNHSDSVFSLRFNQTEWLDANYPTPKERAWWGNFVGGITQRISGIQDIAAIEEKRDMDFVELEDNFNNTWYGLKITTHYHSDPILKGTSTENYILTLPGLALLHRFTKVLNQSGAIIKDKTMYRRFTIQFDEPRTKVTFNEKDVVYKVGDQSIDLKLNHFLQIESPRPHNIIFYSEKNDVLIDSQKEYVIVYTGQRMTIPDQSSKVFEGDFVFFSEDHVDKEALYLLDYIKF